MLPMMEKDPAPFATPGEIHQGVGHSSMADKLKFRFGPFIRLMTRMRQKNMATWNDVQLAAAGCQRLLGYGPNVILEFCGRPNALFKYGSSRTSQSRLIVSR
jgi:hypothetical protein